MEEEKFRVRCYDKNAERSCVCGETPPLDAQLYPSDGGARNRRFSSQTENVQRTGSTSDRALSGRAGWICTGTGTSGHQLTVFSE